jgi:hypothetical protein
MYECQCLAIIKACQETVKHDNVDYSKLIIPLICFD